MIDRIVIHYSEIGIKGKNRAHFENALVRNVRNALGDQARVEKRYGRVVAVPAPGADTDDLSRRLSRLPGIAHLALGRVAEKDVDAIGERAVELLRNSRFGSFGVKCKRSDKSFPLTSQEIGAKVGAAILRDLGGKVDLTSPEVWLTVELTHREALIYTGTVSGPGGLPVGTGGRVVASLSGGIDSPVAAWMLMKRGCQVIFGHIRNETQFAAGVEDKIAELVNCLTSVQLRSKLYVLPFGDLQRLIIALVPAKLRMIVYRRFMMRLLNRVAEMEKAHALVTGDSLGQVASQTLDNLRCIHSASTLPVLSPLIGLNKEEIVTLARQVGTFEHSIEPYPDCCSFMIAPHPETRAELAEIERYESHLDEAQGLMDACLEKAEIKHFGFR